MPPYSATPPTKPYDRQYCFTSCSVRAVFTAIANPWEWSKETALMPAVVVEGKPKTILSSTPPISVTTRGVDQRTSRARRHSLPHSLIVSLISQFQARTHCHCNSPRRGQ